MSGTIVYMTTTTTTTTTTTNAFDFLADCEM